jgi:hypothetical protein
VDAPRPAMIEASPVEAYRKSIPGLLGSSFQVAQDAFENLLVAIVIFPVPKVADVALVAQLHGPRFSCAHHCVVKPNGK